MQRRVLALALLAAGCASNLPLPDDLSGDAITKQIKGKELLERAVAIHGGREAWDQVGDVTFTVRDAWRGMMKMMAPDFPEMPVTIGFAYNYALAKGRMEFPAAPGLVWGHDSKEGWIERDGRRAFDGVEDATFIVPTIAYFFALPFKFLDAGAQVFYAGRRERGGKPMETVLVVYGEGVGAAADRYLAYFDPETGYLAYIAFTVKEAGELAEGGAEYAEWRNVDGLVMAKRIELEMLRPFGARIHTMESADVKLRAPVDRKLYEKPDARG